MKYGFIGIFTLICLSASISQAANRSCKIRIINKSGAPVSIAAEIADTAALRETGLMNRKELPVNQGMLFVFESERMLNFWMKNTYIPLSIAFIDRNRTINEIYDMNPLDLSLTPSRRPARYALEMGRGWFAKNNITRGCKILFNGCFGK